MTKVHIAVLAVASAILTILLFVPPVIGLADQGDFARIMHPFKIEYPPDLSKADQYFCYVQTKYIITPERPPGRSRLPYFSTELLFGGAAAVLHSVAFRPNGFDIRLLGLVHALAFLGATFLILYGTRYLNRPGSIILAGLVILIFCDAGYLAYFNSFYSESASYIFGLAYIGSTLLMVQAPRRSLWHLSLFTICAMTFIAAKPQNSPLAAVIACFIWFSVRPLEQTAKPWKRACVASACIILLSAFVSFARSPASDETLYNSIFNELLLHSPTPEADLREIGLSSQLARYAGTDFWDPRGCHSSDLFPGNTNRMRVVSFYITHPRRFLRLAQRGSEAGLSNRYPELGNFERGSGKPCRSLTNSFAIWDKIRSNLNHFWLLGVFFSANLVLPFLISRGREQRVRCLFVFQATLSIMAILVFLIAILADGVWLQKHLLLTNFLFDCCLVGDLLWLCSGVSSFTPILRGHRERIEVRRDRLWAEEIAKASW